MGIVIELQREAMSKDADILTILRKAYLVARKLKLKEFQKWVENELNGYPHDESVPKYRKLHGEVMAYNPMRGWIPVIFQGGENPFSDYDAHDPIGNLLDVYEKGAGKAAFVPFPDTVNEYLSSYSSFSTKFHLELPTNILYSAFEQIRNTILDWAITLEENGIEGEELKFTRDEVTTARETGSIYHYTLNFFGDVSNSQIQQAATDSEQRMDAEP